MHIATLLTRGADKGPKDKIGPSFRPIAVATWMTMESLNTLAAIDGDDEVDLKGPGLSNEFIVTQNPTLDGPTTFLPTEIQSKDLNPVEMEQLLSRYIPYLPFHMLL